MDDLSALPSIDPSAHRTLAELERGLLELPPRPRDRATIDLMVARTADRQRSTPQSARLSVKGGMPRDRWALGKAKPEQQLTLMETSIATLIAGGQPLTLFGDNLFADLDLSEANLPIGTRLRAGEVLFEVTPEPHDGCKKFRARFGGDALRLVAHKTWRHNNYRGIYITVIKEGTVSIGTPIEVLR